MRKKLIIWGFVFFMSDVISGIGLGLFIWGYQVFSPNRKREKKFLLEMYLLKSFFGN